MDYAISCTVDGTCVTYPLHPGRNTLGRQADASDITLNFEGVSRSHAAIEISRDGIRIIDLHSKNGTFVNGARVLEHTLQAGDEISLGPANLLFDSGQAVFTPKFKKHSLFETVDLKWSETPSSLGETPQGEGRSRLFNSLLELGAFLVTDDEGADVYRDCLQQVARLFSFRRACLLVLNDLGEPEIRSCYPESPSQTELGISRTMIDTVVREHRPLLVRDTKQRPLSESVVFHGIRSALAVPLLGDRGVLGVLYLDHDIGHAYEERHLKRLQLMGNLVAAKIIQAATRKEMKGASYIQASMLCRVPAQPSGLQTAFRLEPCADVGGDLYETLALPDGRYLYALGDVSGHQFDAAMAMSNVMATMRALAPRAESPLQLIEDIQKLATDRLPRNGFVTLFLGFFDPSTQQLEYVNAGHDPPVLFLPDVQGKPALELESTGPPVGMQIPIPLESASVELPPGSLLCMWSDGIFEAARPGMLPEQFSRERLVQLLTQLRDQPVEEIITGVFTELETFLDGTHARDDCTMLLLRRDAQVH